MSVVLFRRHEAQLVVEVLYDDDLRRSTGLIRALFDHEKPRKTTSGVGPCASIHHGRGTTKSGDVNSASGFTCVTGDAASQTN